MLKKYIKILFFILFELFFLSTVFSCLYVATSWRSHNYLIYLPEHRVYPQYSLESGEVTNSDEVTFWSDSEYVPNLNMVIENVFVWLSENWLMLFILFFIFILPIYRLTRQDGKKWPWIIVYYQLLMTGIMVLVWM